MKLLVIGASGQVALALAQVSRPGLAVVTAGRPELNLEAPATLYDAIHHHLPDVVASVGAYTAVDQAESEPEKAHRVNALGPERIARICAGRDVPLIHVSTDYVFSGEKTTPYVETDPVGPQSVYGRSKLEGEQRVAATHRRHAILRTAWVFSHEGKNFLRTMLRLAKARPSLGVVDDQIGCPTYAPDLAEAIVKVAARLGAEDRSDLYGVFHAAGSGEASWKDFAVAIFQGSSKRRGPVAEVKAITTAEYPTPAHRPANSRLDCSKLANVYGVRLRPWPEATEACLDETAAGDFAVD